MGMGMGMGKAEIDQETRGRKGSDRCIGFDRTSQESLPRGRWAYCTAKNQ
jgi:hypothetical protein